MEDSEADEFGGEEPELPPETLDELGPLGAAFAAFAHLDPDEMRRSCPKEIPKDFMEAMIALAQGKSPPAEAGNSLPKPKSGPRSAGRSDQFELF